MCFETCKESCENCSKDDKVVSLFPEVLDEASPEDILNDIDTVTFALKKFMNFYSTGCACADTCDEIHGDCAENPQCTGEFADQATRECEPIVERLRAWTAAKRSGVSVLPKAS